MAAKVPLGDKVSFSPFLGGSFKQVKDAAVTRRQSIRGDSSVTMHGKKKKKKHTQMPVAVIYNDYKIVNLHRKSSHSLQKLGSTIQSYDMIIERQ